MHKSLLSFSVLILFFATASTAQNVGIGTNSPQSKLHIAGAIRSDTLIGAGVRNLFAAPNGRIYDSLVTPSTLNWEINGNANITPTKFLGTTNANDLIFKTNSIERARILATGNVGIGTAAPGHLLELLSATTTNIRVGGSGLDYTNATIELRSNTAGSRRGLGVIMTDVVDDNSWYAGRPYGIGFGSNDFFVINRQVASAVFNQSSGLFTGAVVATTTQNFFTIKNDGNIGIGNVNPNNKLEITSSAVNTSGLRFTNLISTSTAVAANGKALSVDVNGDVILVPSSAINNAWLLTGNGGTTAGTNFLGTTDAQDLVFKTNNTEKVRVLASNGYVGIGTAAPNVLFANSSTHPGAQSTMGTQPSKGMDWTANGFGYAASFFNEGIVSSSAGVLIKTANTTSNVAVLTLNSGATATGNDLMTVLGNGYVGISTTTPAEKFTIENGNMQFGESIGTNISGGAMLFSDWGSNTDAIFFQRQNLSSDISNLNLNIGDNYRQNTGGGDRFNVGASSSGTLSVPFTAIFTVESEHARVGINTTNPNSDLHVAGTIESNAGAGYGSAYAKLSPDGALLLRREPAGPYPNSNGYINFEKAFGVGYDFRMSFERDFGTLGSLVFSDNINPHMTIAQGTGNVGIDVDRALGATTTFQVGANGADGISIMGGGLGGGDVGDLIFTELAGGVEKGRIFTNTSPGVAGLHFSGSNIAGGSTQMVILQGGNVGIGTTGPVQKLDVAGDALVNGTFYASDIRYKNNIKNLEGTLSKLSLLRGISYTYNPEYTTKRGFSDAAQLGVVAQEVEKIFPELVTTDAEGFKAVDYAKFAPIFIEAFKEQQQQINELKKQNEEILKLLKK